MLVRQDVPLIFGTYRNPRIFGCMTSPSFGNSIGDFPKIRCYLGFLPVAFIVMPVVAAPYLHTGILLSVKFFIMVVAGGKIFFRTFLFGGFCCHNKKIKAPENGGTEM